MTLGEQNKLKNILQGMFYTSPLPKSEKNGDVKQVQKSFINSEMRRFTTNIFICMSVPMIYVMNMEFLMKQ